MIVLIACAGDGRRWANYLNVPKQLIKIDKEPILHRTVRQVKSFEPNTEIIIFAQNELLRVPDTEFVLVTTLTKSQMALETCKEKWNKHGDSVLLFGDVYYTDAAIEKIFGEFYMSDNYMFFGRLNPSQITGKKWGELFAVRFIPSSHNLFLRAFVEIRGEIDKPIHWHLYRHLIKIALDYHYVSFRNYTEIDDETEDFDFPDDFDTWMLNVKCLAKPI